MDVNEEKNNKKLLWVGISFGGVTLIAIAAMIAVLLSAPIDKATSNGSDSSSSASESSQINESLVPKITSSSIERVSNSDKALITFATEKINNSYIVEYRIQDSSKETLADGVLNKTNTASSQVSLVNGENDFIIKLRVSNEKAYSQWMPVKVLNLKIDDLPEEAGVNTEVKPNDAYFATSWAQEIGGEENFTLAIKAAWGAEPAVATDNCMVLNNGVISPGEMLPPLPSNKPDEYDLKYQATIVNSNVDLTYLWCVHN